jgi:DNA primase large subunit
MAFCRTDELRSWFIGKEIDLFMARFDELTVDGRKEFLRINNIDFEPVSVHPYYNLSQNIHDKMYLFRSPKKRRKPNWPVS